MNDEFKMLIEDDHKLTRRMTATTWIIRSIRMKNRHNISRIQLSKYVAIYTGGQLLLKVLYNSSAELTFATFDWYQRDRQSAIADCGCKRDSF